jgi:hypothetical protein
LPNKTLSMRRNLVTGPHEDGDNGIFFCQFGAIESTLFDAGISKWIVDSQLSVYQ